MERDHGRRARQRLRQHDRFDFAEFNEVLTSGKAPGRIALVTLDGDAREVADELAFPKSMVITPGRQGGNGTSARRRRARAGVGWP
jgi:hypothetical protein